MFKQVLLGIVLPLVMIALMAITANAAGFYRCLSLMLTKAADSDDLQTLKGAVEMYDYINANKPWPIRALDTALRSVFGWMTKCKELLRFVKKS